MSESELEALGIHCMATSYGPSEFFDRMLYWKAHPKEAREFLKKLKYV